jgi:hypothetical protein
MWGMQNSYIEWMPTSTLLRRPAMGKLAGYLVNININFMVQLLRLVKTSSECRLVATVREGICNAL